MTAHQLDTWSNAAYLGAAVYCGIVGAWAAMVLFTALAVASFGYHWWEGWADRWEVLRQQYQDLLGVTPPDYEKLAAADAKRAATRARHWARLDSAAMFALLLGIAVAAIVLLLALPIPWWAIPPTVLGLGAVLRYVVIPHTPIRTAHVVVAIAVLALVAVALADWRRAAIGAGLLTVGSFFRALEMPRLFKGRIQVHGLQPYAHAMWHLLAAAGTAALAGGGV